MGIVRRLAHPLLGSVFLTTGVETLLDPGPRVQRARESGLDQLPYGDAASVIRASAAVQILGGAMLVTNRAPRLAALALAATLVPSTYTGHPFWTETDKQVRAQQRSHFAKNVGLLGGLLATVAERRKRKSSGAIARVTRQN
jgi:uncharacterized membrane protein YphA (DoxX/SURF4 family)